MAKEQDDGLGVGCLSPDHPGLYFLPLGLGLKQLSSGAVPDGEHRAGEKQKEASRGGPGTCSQ